MLARGWMKPRVALFRTPTLLPAHLGPEELHEADPPVYIDIHEGFEALGGHEVHDQGTALRLNQIDILGAGKVPRLRCSNGRALEGRHDIIATHLSERATLFAGKEGVLALAPLLNHYTCNYAL